MENNSPIPVERLKTFILSSPGLKELSPVKESKTEFPNFTVCSSSWR